MLDHGLHPPRLREKKRNPWRQHVHRATRPRSYAIDKVWEAVTSRCLGNGRSDARCKQYGGVKSIICYLCFMQHAWSCYFFIYLYSLILLYCISNITRYNCERYVIPYVRVNLYCFYVSLYGPDDGYMIAETCRLLWCLYDNNIHFVVLTYFIFPSSNKYIDWGGEGVMFSVTLIPVMHRSALRERDWLTFG